LAHYAQIDENNVVTQVIVVADADEQFDGVFVDESKGVEFCYNLLGGTWKKTSYNGNIRKNYAGIGYTYDASRDAFIPPKPFASWVLVEDTCQWTAPVAFPEDGKRYSWDEATTSWVEVA
jgi:hypothetical protein